MTSNFRTVAGAVLLAATTLLTWYAWLGRDTRYQLDANGNESGPWTTGQVAGCALTLLVLLVIAVLLRVQWLVAAATLTIAFAAAWTVQAARTDETGLFLVGAIMVFAGTAAASTLVAFCVHLARRGRDGRPVTG
jgi:surface polysaccharide O-acyltransferase-like enzyme